MYIHALFVYVFVKEGEDVKDGPQHWTVMTEIEIGNTQLNEHFSHIKIHLIAFCVLIVIFTNKNVIGILIHINM